MNNPQELKDKMNLKYAEYLNKIFEGVLPKDFIELFKKAVFHVPPALHKLHVGTVRQICSKETKTLLNREVGIILDVISNCPPYHLYPDVNSYIQIQEQLEKVAGIWQMQLSKKEAEIQKEFSRPSLLNSNGASLHKI